MSIHQAVKEAGSLSHARATFYDQSFGIDTDCHNSAMT